MRERNVFEDTRANCGVAANRFVHIAANHQELTICGGVRQARIVDALKRKMLGEARVNERNQNFFAERLHFLLRRVRDEGGRIFARIGKGVARRSGLEHRIRINEEEPIAACRARADSHGIVFADPTAGYAVGFEDAKGRDAQSQFSEV